MKKIRNKPLPFEFPGGNWYDKEEEKAALKVIRNKSPFRYYGPKCTFEVEKFEKEFAKFIGTKYALGINSGTQALAVAMAALGIGPGAEVIIPGYMWIAIPASILRLGAIPVLAEIDDTFTLDPEDIEKRITKRTKLIVVVHMSGAPADMKKILKISKKYNIPVLEDCSQAIGGEIDGKKLGSFGNIGTYSFQLNKILGTGEGGMIVTDILHLFRRADAIHDLGYPRVNGRLITENTPYALWGFGGRMNEITGAIGRVQLKKVPKIIKAMKKAKDAIKKGIADIPEIKFRKIVDEKGDTGAFLILILPDAKIARRFAEEMNTENLYAGLSKTMRVCEFGMHIYYNIHSLVEKHSNSPDGFPWTLEANKESVYSYHKGTLPRSDELMEKSIIIPVPSVMTKKDIDDVIKGIHIIAKRLF
ncbi:MAG: DegT/DnrJ/EryC1/StrS family aminotransferase [Candidatus Omnitrophica bacterium]|nr:DegT/DnrJ/EryC1/StrS family aminotransferase [Candidatus Omnitrophota bacterium]